MQTVVVVFVRRSLLILSIVPWLVVPLASADQYSSSGYKIDASLMNNFGDAGTSAGYTMVASGGESIIGTGSGGSYKLTSGYVAQLENSLQLTVQPSGLVSYYPLNEGVGTATYDGSANSAAGNLQTGAAWIAGKLSGGVDTTSGDVQVADNSALPTGQTMTVGLWAKQTSSGTSKALLTQWDYTGGTPTSAGWALETSSADATKLRFVVGANQTDTEANYVDTAASSWTSGSWHHIVVVYDGTQSTATNRVKIYIDGAAMSTTMTGTTPTTLQNSASYLDIGDFRGLNRPFNGSLDHIKIFDRTLSADEVLSEYTAQNAGNPSGLRVGTLIPGTSTSAEYDTVVQTDASSYTLAVNQDQNLTSGANSIPAVSGTIASPVTWVESTTKGLGFTLFDTNATTIPGKWSSGAAYAAFPGTSTSFYTRMGQQTTKDWLSLRIRADVTSGLPDGTYSNTITITGTITP